MAKKTNAQLSEAERVEAERVEAERVEAERVEAERVEAERVEAERAVFYRTTRPIWSNSGNIIPALRPVTQKELSASVDELIKIGHVERYDPEKVKK